MKTMLTLLTIVALAGMAAAACPPGFTENVKTKACEVQPVCPPGFKLHTENPICIATPGPGNICPKDSQFNDAENTCDRAAICPTGSLVDEDSGKCLVR